MRRIAVVLIALAVSGMASAQREDAMLMVRLAPEKSGSPKGTVCYASNRNEFTNIGPPAEYIRALKARAAGARTKAANIIVTYDGFTNDAQAAFQEAVDIWESILQTNITIRIHARWTVLGQGVLGSASPGAYVTNFDGAQKRNVLYPIALAEKIANKDLNNSTDPDIVASFNSANTSWHYGLTGSAPPAGKYDLVSIVLHEIGHGLGITHAYSVDAGQGVIPDFFDGMPVIYETSIQSGDGKNMVNDFTPPSVGLKDVITSDNLLYSSALVKAANLNSDAILYAPTTYSAGSSVAHLSDASYPAGTPNSLMTPFIGAAERILDPGPIIRAILNDIGWTGSFLKHVPIVNTENTTGPYHAVVKIISDGGYDANTVTLNYRTTSATFTPLAMTATGNANEFAVNLPVGSSKYSYFITVKDNDQRIFNNPGMIIKPGVQPVQQTYVFNAGPDNTAPFINHTPKEFITATDTLRLEAIISDNLGLSDVRIEWEIKGVAQPDKQMTLKSGTDSTYVLNIVFNAGTLNTGDKVEYRIRAKDSSIAGNVAAKPSPTTFYEVKVTGLSDTQNSYANNFDNLSSADFFGDGFTVSKPAGFNNGAVHSSHPYAAGNATGVNLNFIYNLRVPIRISASDAVMKFDEIVLVEPGQLGVAWPDADFFDYVVVEGSTDGGQTWIAISDGYDARFNAEWSNLWAGSISSNNSTAVGTPSLYKTHQFNLLNKFKAGDEVAFRFRLFSDPFSFGWGWSIDNLKIQVDDVPPTILHQHTDFLLTGVTSIDVNTKVTDKSGVGQIFVDYNKNGGAVTSTEVIVNPTTDTYTQKIDLASLGLQAGDEFQYKVRATDANGNTGSYPPSGFIKTAIISLTTSIDELVTDFSAPGTDLTGNFFTTEQPTAFTSAGMSSIHPYLAGIDIDLVSEFAWMTRKPIKVSSSNPRIAFDDVAIVEYNGANVKDYVVVEASKDGITWDPLLGPYAANSVAQWKTIFDAASTGTQGVMQKHLFDITASGKFKAGDVILIRFRLHSDATGIGWGWFVDNLTIQGPITGIEPTVSKPAFTAWPNPVTNGSLNLSMALPSESEVSVEILSTHGQVLSSERFSAPAGDFSREYEVSAWPQGFYIVRVQSDFGTAIQKIIKLK